MKKKLISIIMYAINLIALLIPWFPVGEHRYNVIQLGLEVVDKGVPALAKEAGIVGINLTTLTVCIYAELLLIGLYMVSAILYLIRHMQGKEGKQNLFNIAIALTFAFLHTTTNTYGGGFGGVDLLGATVPMVVLLFTALEYPFRDIAESWKEVTEKARSEEEEDEAWQREMKERLRFDGKYTSQFYQILFKNFRKNWKDYVLLLVCNTVLCTCMIMGLGTRQVVSGEYNLKSIQLFDGLQTILINAMIPMGILYIFTIILLFFYYLKCRARNYGVFLTLGMRRSALYYFVAIEYISVFLISLILGSMFGTIGIAGIAANSEKLLGITITFSEVGIKPYFYAVLVIVFICVISVMAARDIFVDFKVGRATDLRAIGEWLPMDFRKILIAIGLILCGFGMIRYGNHLNFENEILLFVFFLGLFLMIRYGMAEYLLKERKTPTYLKKLLAHNQLFHKSKTNAGYLWVLIVIQFCVLFYFSFQMISANIAEDAEELYPYDVVCLAGENDTEFFENLNEKYEVEMFEYPALRISTYDSTEEVESKTKPIQGQHIAISESTYHALKQYQDVDYEPEDLGLDAEGKYIHIVYQQDKSVKGQPLSFYGSRKKPLLHIGQPCRGFDVLGLSRAGNENVTYQLYQVKSEEIGSLVGVFRQGTRENLVVFSDEYFETAKELWKTTNILTSDWIENEEERIDGLTIYQGVTKLVLINGKEEEMEQISVEMDIFEENHLAEEDLVYRALSGSGVYDSSVSYHYMKADAVSNLATERLMKITMNGLVIVLFFVMNLMLVLIKMLSEMDLNKKRAEFLNCMGMYRKERIHLIRKEIFEYFYLLPVSVAAGLAVIFTALVFHARMYTKADIFAYLKMMIPMWGVYLVAMSVIMWMMVTIYAYKVEGRKDGRSS